MPKPFAEVLWIVLAWCVFHGVPLGIRLLVSREIKARLSVYGNGAILLAATFAVFFAGMWLGDMTQGIVQAAMGHPFTGTLAVLVMFAAFVSWLVACALLGVSHIVCFCSSWGESDQDAAKNKFCRPVF
ncbi:MAG: hypothetical protein IT405_02735 [Candidatus Yanofskybacteria bacterium]|nr:hypothetical protein [Candidatus Yanofskybacteria bacterium]